MKGELKFVEDTSDIGLIEQISNLRKAEYAKAKGLAVDLETLRWKDSDGESYVLVAKVDGEVVSTMRGEVINDPALLEAKLECAWEFPMKLQYPVLLLSRAATNTERRSLGLNLLLRYHFLRLAEFHGISQVLGTFVLGSPRENSLRDMGYQFFENAQGWQKSTYRSLGRVAVVALDLRTARDQAFGYCEKMLPIASKEFVAPRFEGAMKVVRSV